MTRASELVSELHSSRPFEAERSPHPIRNKFLFAFNGKKHETSNFYIRLVEFLTSATEKIHMTIKFQCSIFGNCRVIMTLPNRVSPLAQKLRYRFLKLANLGGIELS